MKKIILLISVLFLASCGNDEVEVNGAKMEYEELLAEIEKNKTELAEIEEEKSSAQTELSKIEGTLSEDKEKYDALEKLAADQKTIESSVEESKSTLASLQSEIESAKTELEGLESEIVKVAGGPISLNAGFYYVSKDVPPGRYKLTAQEGDWGNVFVRNKNDYGSKVSDTFGGDELESFIFEAVEGDEIEATIPIHLFPVE